MNADIKTALIRLRQGKAPGHGGLLDQITVETDKLAAFFRDEYLSAYIAAGGSKIKFVTGKPGSGKTHFLQLLARAAEGLHFICVRISARDVWLHDFKDIYAEVFQQSQFMGSLTKCAHRLIAEMGYDPQDIPEGMTFVDYLASAGELDAVDKKEIRNQLREMFLKNPLLDNNFAKACSLLTGAVLGHPHLEDANRDKLLGWLAGRKDVKAAAIRNLGLSPVAITKYNARHMLRSLAEVARLAGVPGIVVLIDDVDILVNPTSMDTIRYTKMKRDDAYESIRELIDEIDTLRNILFVYAFERQMLDNDLCGIKSYQALWMRVQNEIVSNRFNRFTEIIDLDRFAVEAFGKEALLRMSEKVAQVLQENGQEIAAVSGETADAVLSQSPYAKTAIPRQIVLATVQGEYNAEDIHDDRF